MADYNSEVHGSATLLEKAQILHDQFVAEAKVYKEKVMRESGAEAEKLLADAYAERERVLGDLENDKAALSEEIATLQRLEAEYRGSLVDTLNGFLARVKLGTEGKEDSIEESLEETKDLGTETAEIPEELLSGFAIDEEPLVEETVEEPVEEVEEEVVAEDYIEANDIIDEVIAEEQSSEVSVNQVED